MPSTEHTDSGSTGAEGLFAAYELDGFFDEVFDREGRVRPHYAPLLARLTGFTPDDLLKRARLRDAAFRSQGITFTVYDEGEGIERTFPMDLLPRILPADEWDHIEAGLVQRVQALNVFLDDLYVGERAALHEGIIPTWVVESSDGFCREAFGIPVPLGARCLVAGVDLVRDGDGTYRVLEDNLRNPSGISYVIENRVAMTRVLPTVFADQQIRPVDHYGRSLLNALHRVAPAASSDRPTVVVLTPGVFNSAYFEHVFLASQMGVELVEGRDLVVDDHVVSMRTTQGLQRVDVIYRRIDDDFLDPVPFRADSTLGVPGLMAAARAGNVTIANAVGNGVADDKAVYAYVPDFIRYYLGEEPIIPNVPTYLLWDDDQREDVLEPARPARDQAGGRGRRLRHRDRPGRLRRGARDLPAADPGRPARLHRPGGRVAVAAPVAVRRPPRGSSHRPAPVRAVGRRHRGHPRWPHPRGHAQGLAGRELVPRRWLEGHLGAGGPPRGGRRL